MFEVPSILKAFSGNTRMIPNPNSSATPQPGKALTQETNRRFLLVPYSHHISPNLLIFVHGSFAKGKSLQIALLKRTKVN
jgi:poly(3-hydroxybutyrate) depolymerase